MFFSKKNMDIELAEKIIKKNKIPILIHYEPWKKLFSKGFTKTMESLSKEITSVLDRKKELEKELSRLQSLKPKNMAKIIYLSNEVNENKNPAAEMELDRLKEEMEEINENIEAILQKLEQTPKEIQEKNLELLKATIQYAYEDINGGENRLKEVESFIIKLREELNRLREEKENLEEKISAIYNFLHSLLGYEEMEKLDHKLLK